MSDTKEVYLVRLLGTNWYKIGIAANTRKRMASIQTSNPSPVGIVATTRVRNARAVEKHLHDLYAYRRTTETNTEWFSLSRREVEEIVDYLHRVRGPRNKTTEKTPSFMKRYQGRYPGDPFDAQ